MTRYKSGRQRDFQIGIRSYTEDLTTLEVIGKVGIGTTLATSALTVYGDGLFTGVVTAKKFVGEFDIVSSNFQEIITERLIVTGVATINQSITTSAIIGFASVGVGTFNRLDAKYIDASIVTGRTRLSTGGIGTAINITQDTISGPNILYIDPAGVGVNTGSVVVKGDLIVDGEFTYINSTSVEIADFNVGIATTVGSNILLDGAGIGIGSTNIRKYFTYSYVSDSLKSSENFDIESGKVYNIGAVEVLSSTTLGLGVTDSNLRNANPGIISDRPPIYAAELDRPNDYLLLYDDSQQSLRKVSLQEASIQGPQGTQGTQGLQGDQGVQGLQGDQGVQGLQGDQGV